MPQDEDKRRDQLADPVKFAQNLFGIVAWSRQAEILHAVAKYPAVTVRAGTFVGCKHAAAILTHWWLLSGADRRVVFVAPHESQINQDIWRRYKDLFRMALQRHRQDLARAAALPDELPMHGYKIDDGTIVMAAANTRTRSIDLIRHQRGSGVLFIVYRASGVNDRVLDAIDEQRNSGAKVVLFSQPMKRDGFFYRTHLPDAPWHRIAISAEENPNIREKREVVPGLRTQQMLSEYSVGRSTDSDEYRSYISGEFPLAKPGKRR